MTLYSVASRPIWALACAYVVSACRRGLPSIVNGFLAHPAWTPLARLTYGAYLVHPLIIKLVAARQLQFYTFSSWDFVQHVIANGTMAYGGAILLWLLAERPIAAMASGALRKQQAKPEPIKKGLVG